MTIGITAYETVTCNGKKYYDSINDHMMTHIELIYSTDFPK
jgi:hypothetical protein